LTDTRLERRYRRACAAPLTYPEVGATRGSALPAGYHHAERRELVGRGEAVFDASRAAVRQWAMQRRAGIAIYPPDAVPDAGTTVLAELRFGPLGVVAPCRVVWTIDDPGASGFGYGTLPGHPERGEEAFVVERDSNDDVWFVIRAFSRPATWYAQLGAIVARRIQRRVTETYLRALVSP